MRNSSLVERPCAENDTGLKHGAEAADGPEVRGRGALSGRRRSVVRPAGAQASENAGMSSEKAGENPARRKPKGS